MEPLVQRVMNDLQTLKQQAEAIQAAEEFNAPRFPDSFPVIISDLIVTSSFTFFLLSLVIAVFF